MQSMKGQEWQDTVTKSSHLSIEEKKEQVNGKLRAKMERQINELEIVNDEQRLKHELLAQENTVLKQTLAKQK